MLKSKRKIIEFTDLENKKKKNYYKELLTTGYYLKIKINKKNT